GMQSQGCMTRDGNLWLSMVGLVGLVVGCDDSVAAPKPRDAGALDTTGSEASGGPRWPRCRNAHGRFSLVDGEAVGSCFEISWTCLMSSNGGLMSSPDWPWIQSSATHTAHVTGATGCIELTLVCSEMDCEGFYPVFTVLHLKAPGCPGSLPEGTGCDAGADGGGEAGPAPDGGTERGGDASGDGGG